MTIKMDPIWKAKWVEALRSGKYEQGHKQLQCDDGSLCCLGVLTKLVMGTIPDDYAIMPHLPFSIWSKTGMSQMGELNTHIGHFNKLWHLNDLGRYTFEQIADVIEEQF